VLRLSAWTLGLVLLVAAVPKISDPPAFAQALHGFNLVPTPALAPLALVLPWLEAWVALGLITGLARRSAALLALVLMLTFLWALGWNLQRGHAVDCGCFGRAAPHSEAERLRDMKFGLGRNLLLALLALTVVRATQRPSQNRREGPTDAH
jgi:uncharacterized membrane protein YphA (DoxX/SURF4 family)